MTKIWLLGPGPESWAQNCATNMEMILKRRGHTVKPLNHISFTFLYMVFWYDFEIFGLGSRAPTCEQIWTCYGICLTILWFDTFTFVSHSFHVICICCFTCWGSGPRSGTARLNSFWWLARWPDWRWLIAARLLLGCCRAASLHVMIVALRPIFWRQWNELPFQMDACMSFFFIPFKFVVWSGPPGQRYPSIWK